MRPIRSVRHLVSFCVGLLGLINSANAQKVIIDEIMYNPGETNLLEKWFELHNAGGSPVNLSGWKITKGVSFRFPTTTILPAAGYLVVAANAAAFHAKYPTVSNVVAGWTGTLNHDGEEIRLEDNQGNTVESFTYAPDGEWARRQMGPPDILNRQGWQWSAEHNGLGKSLELINLNLPRGLGQNWTESVAVGGTPGAPNSVVQANSAPLILNPTHRPAVPRSTDAVTISARIVDEQNGGLTIMLHWRIDGATNFTVTPMLDDGTHQDGFATDGLFAAVLPPQPDKTIIEFYFTARDAAGNERTYPSVVPSEAGRTANLLYQVDDSEYSGTQPIFRLIMSQAEHSYLTNEIWQGQPASDAKVNGTFISSDGVVDKGSTTQVRYLCGFRNRGHGTRVVVPHNFFVSFRKDQLWKGRAGINLNTHYTLSQQIGSALFQRSGIPVADSRPVQVRVNGANLAKPGQEQFGSYAANEIIDEAFAKNQFPLDPDGNLYRGIRDMLPGIDAEADLAWHGPSFLSYTNAYSKESNTARNDWTDLIQLIDVLTNTPSSEYVAAVRQIVQVDEWMRYFAVNTLLDNQEASLGVGAGDDFALYRGMIDPRFWLIPYDFDSVMGRGQRATSYQDGLWRMTSVPAINRFMKQPEFTPLYFTSLKELAATTFSQERMNAALDQLLSGYVDPGTIANLKNFNSNHLAYVLSLIPSGLTATNELPQTNGFARSTTSTAVVFGRADPIKTRSILVNGAPATWAAWRAAWTNSAVNLNPGMNQILVQALDSDSHEISRTNLLIWYDHGAGQSVSGPIMQTATWNPENGPYHLVDSLTVSNGAMLVIEPGTSIVFAAGASLLVAPGARLVAEGTETLPILFTGVPGETSSWGGLVIRGELDSPETRIVYAHFAGNGSTAIHSAGGTVLLDHLTFAATDRQYLSLDDSSFVVSHCTFPAGTAVFELVHGTGGIKSGGQGMFLRNYFGGTQGYSDVVDFTGGNRPQPVVHFIDNVFTGSSDDILDLDGTDGWVEGNIFLHCHKNGSPDSSSAISGGNDGNRTSELTIIGNLFYDCDQAITAKQGNFYTLFHNTIVHQTKVGGLDVDAAVLNLADDGTAEGAGLYLEANIIVDAEKLLRNVTSASITFTNNLLPFPWTGPGGGNSTADPLLSHVPRLEETQFTTWAEAQVLRDWFSLRPGSPALATGPNGRDRGGVTPLGASLFGVPDGLSNQTNLTLTIGFLRHGGEIPAAGWPQGSGYISYIWRLDEGSWSEEIPLETPIVLSGLANGPHHVELAGRRDTGLYQNDPLLSDAAVITVSPTWTVDPGYLPPKQTAIRINEVLARRTSRAEDPSGSPARIELFNEGPNALDLAGMTLTDDLTRPAQFVFPAGTVLSAGGYLDLTAEPGPGEMRTGFVLDAEGDSLYLLDRPTGRGVLLDSVRFGTQVADFSIGRRLDGSWGLCEPTFGQLNRAVATGNQGSLKINEWFTDGRFALKPDFIELFNPEKQPVSLDGVFLSDSAATPARTVMAPLSFIAPEGFVTLIADGNPTGAANHLHFKLSPEGGLIILSAPDLTPIDAINYASQRTDVSEGRSPNGAPAFATFSSPTPASANPGTVGAGCTTTNISVSLLRLETPWKFNETENLDEVNWTGIDYDDSTWLSGPALLGVEDCNCLPPPGIQTPLHLGRTTYYFRTHFLVETNLEGFLLQVQTVLDDGAVVYLNGASFLTNGVDAAALRSSTLSSRNVGDAGLESYTLPSANLRPGTNVLAVELHQIAPTSSDVIWGLSIDAVRTVTNCPPNLTDPIGINEIFVSSRTAGAQASILPYVELFNQGTNVVDLHDLSLSDDPAFPRKWIAPPNTLIGPGGYFRITCDDRAAASQTNSGFGLSPSGGTILLYDSPDRGGLLDGINFGLQTPRYSIGRVPDGVGDWILGTPSADSPNSSVSLGDPSTLRLNEWLADPASGSDWFEIFNPGSQPVALEGLYLTDTVDDPTATPIAPLSFVGTGPDAFVQFFADGHPEAGLDHVDFALAKSGEILGLYAPSGEILDGVRFGSQKPGVSQGRYPNGDSNIVSFDRTPSPGAGNYLPPPGDSDADGLPDEWELRFFGNLAQDASGDFDGDGMSEQNEWVAGTNPNDPASQLRIDSITVTPGSSWIGFRAEPNKTYSVVYRNDLVDQAWLTLTNLPAQASSVSIQVEDPTRATQTRYYRIITPAVP